MHKFYGRILCALFFVLPAASFAQDIRAAEISQEYMSTETYGDNGEYKMVTNDGTVLVKGRHINKIKTGEFSYYDQRGKLQRTENYLEGQLHGPSVQYFNNPQLSGRQEFFKGRKVGYEYAFDRNGDTLFMAGPYPAEAVQNYTMLVRSRLADAGIYNSDSLLFSSGKPLEIHHLGYSREKNTYPDRYITVSLYGEMQPAYAPDYCEELVQRVRNFYGTFLVYFPDDRKQLVHVYKEKDGLQLKSDSGYVVNFYSNGQVKDSIRLCDKEGKICRVGFNNSAKKLYAVRLDKTEPRQTSNLYYSDSGKLLYEISSIKDKPDKLLLHDKTVKTEKKPDRITDCFGSVYFFNAAYGIDSSMTKLEYKYSKRTPLKKDTYYTMEHKATPGKKRFRAIAITETSWNDYFTDSTLAVKGNTTSVITYRKDSLAYVLKTPGRTAGLSKFVKLVETKGKLYLVQSGVRYDYMNSKQLLFLNFEEDTLPVIKSILLTESEFKKALTMRSVATMSKKDFLAWMDNCQAASELYEKNRKSFTDSPGKTYELFFPLSNAYFSYAYSMGYNPYFGQAELDQLVIALNLSKRERMLLFSKF